MIINSRRTSAEIHSWLMEVMKPLRVIIFDLYCNIDAIPSNLYQISCTFIDNITSLAADYYFDFVSIALQPHISMLMKLCIKLQKPYNDFLVQEINDCREFGNVDQAVYKLYEIGTIWKPYTTSHHYLEYTRYDATLLLNLVAVLQLLSVAMTYERDFWYPKKK
jgi:hypothetical protein